MALAAISYDVENFVLISTDKAVRATNVMGASKRLAEIILQALSARGSHVNFSMVRFGNVLNSSGSVVPKFRKQIKKGGPVTITHNEVTRFFMTITEAAQLVIQAASMARGGEVFVLDMGEPVKIIELARRMIELSGLTVREQGSQLGDIEIQVTGLRPGEKLFEELLIGGNPEKTSHERVMKANEQFIEWDFLESELETLISALMSRDVSLVRKILERLVPDYSPSSTLVDYTFAQRVKKTK